MCLYIRIVGGFVKLVEKKEFIVGEANIKFLRVDVNNLEEVILEIMKSLNEISWVNRLASDELKEGFLACIEPTINKISEDLRNSLDDENISAIGEYVVSNVARLIIEQYYEYYVLPLAELLKEQLSNNPGFDYHCVSKENIPIFGEAKYVANTNGYGRALSQVVKFIDEKKDKKEISLLSHFMPKEAIKNIVLENKGYSISFSVKTIDTDTLIKNIQKNKNFIKLTKYKEVIVVAVDI